jgi:phenylalanyl-tRNA synthetase alpha chain
MDSKLHLRQGHPLNHIKRIIESHFHTTFIGPEGSTIFSVFDDLSPVVSTKQCFDDVLVPVDHVSRQKNDTFYVNDTTVLRTHTSAHQTELIRSGHEASVS